MRKEELKRRKELIYELICSDGYVPMKIKEIAILLQIAKEQRDELKEVLDALLEEGKIEISKKGKYSKSKKLLATGTFFAHPRGFGFVQIEGEEEEIFIPEEYVREAIHKDTVQILIKRKQNGKRREGAVNKVLEHGIHEVVGTFQKNGNFGFVLVDNQRFLKDIYIPPEEINGAVTGHKVVAVITDFGGKGKKPEGSISEIIGHINDPGVDISSIVKEYELPVEFSPEVLNETTKMNTEVQLEEMSGRTDLRDWLTITIDGEDAKDLDDAITLHMEGEQYILGVHIADVTNYVKEGHPLDTEALNRGTSVYLVDRVIPMLPHALSNGICSLNAGVDRLALSCIMTIDRKGKVMDHQIAETIIQVDERMSYNGVKVILKEEDPKLLKQYKKLIPMLQEMEILAKILREKRKHRGSIDFDFPETVAQDYFWQELPFVYRTHEAPDPDKIEKLSMFIRNFGYGIKSNKDEIHPKELQKLLGRIEDTPEEMLISRLTLRSMKQAKYTTQNTGHFGLAAQYYCHFTSPIRRYPDLQIHRIIKESLHGDLNEKRLAQHEIKLPETAKHSSQMERRAEEAERETVKLKKVEYMEERLGETFAGVISGVTNWGMYVELENTIEGLVHITNIKDDYYIFDEEHQRLIGERSNQIYNLGQKVSVRVIRTDRIGRTIDFELAEDED